MIHVIVLGVDQLSTQLKQMMELTLKLVTILFEETRRMLNMIY